MTLCKDLPSFVTVAMSDNALTDKTEQVILGMKQSLSFQIL